MITKHELKGLLPHGMLKEVAVKAGVSTPAVSKYFSNSTKSSQKIYKAALEVALKCKNEIKHLEQSLTLN